MNKTEIIIEHTTAVNDRNANASRNKSPFGGFTSTDAEDYDKRIEREISRLGQIHNARISEKSKRALGIN